jgi:hypothetical protein
MLMGPLRLSVIAMVDGFRVTLPIHVGVVILFCLVFEVSVL